MQHFLITFRKRSSGVQIRTHTEKKVFFAETIAIACKDAEDYAATSSAVGWYTENIVKIEKAPRKMVNLINRALRIMVVNN